MLEKMNEFFNKRLDGYDEHMMTNIESSDVFYPFTADCLPKTAGAKILDLGCGTGLELEHYFRLNPSAKITGVDLTESMLNALKNKFPEKELSLICGSYFDVPFDENTFDAAVSVESLHHFTKEEKIPLYKKLCKALKNGGSFVLTDYFALSEDEEKAHFEALEEAGFSSVEILGNWGATYTLKANKCKGDLL